MPLKKKIVVIGGNDAGLSAAGRAKRLKPDYDIIVLENTPYVGYASCALPLFISGAVAGDEVSGSTPDTIFQKRGFRIKNNFQALSIDTMNKTVTGKDNVTEQLGIIKYDKLVLATGALPVIPEKLLPAAKHLFTVRNYLDAKLINEYISKNAHKRIVIVGGGFIGLEMAEAFYHLGIHVSIIDSSPRLFPVLTDQFSANLEKLLAKQGIELLTGKEIASVQTFPDNSLEISLHNTLHSIKSDMVIVAAGIQPNTELARKAGIPLSPQGAIIVNHYQQTRRLDVYAAGDCAETFNVVTGKTEWMPFAGIASRQGRIAGSHIAGLKNAFPGALGSAKLKIFDIEFGITGLDLNKALKLGYHANLVEIEQENKPGYIKANCPVSVSLIIDKKTGKILGGQVMGKSDTSARLDIISTAITGKLTLDQLEYLDIGYTPVINNLWDPVAIAANAAKKSINLLKR